MWNEDAMVSNMPSGFDWFLKLSGLKCRHIQNSFGLLFCFISMYVSFGDNGDSL